MAQVAECLPAGDFFYRADPGRWMRRARGWGAIAWSGTWEREHLHALHRAAAAIAAHPECDRVVVAHRVCVSPGSDREVQEMITHGECGSARLVFSAPGLGWYQGAPCFGTPRIVIAETRIGTLPLQLTLRPSVRRGPVSMRALLWGPATLLRPPE